MIIITSMFNKHRVWPCLSLILITMINVKVSGQPVISSFSPASGPIGTTVTISGSNFSTTPANNIVFFGAVKASVTAATVNSLTVVVPLGATYQSISVTVNSLTAYSQLPFHVLIGAGEPLADYTYSLKTNLTIPSNSTKVIQSDIDDDGKSEVIATAGVVNNNNSTICVFKNASVPGAAVFNFPQRYDIIIDTMANDLTACDFDGDGRQDLGATCLVSKCVNILRNTTSAGTISFVPGLKIQLDKEPVCISTADLDKDGKPDLIVGINTASPSSGLSIRIYRNTSVGNIISFAPYTELSIGFIQCNSIAFGDFNNDSKPDLVANSAPNGINQFSIFTNTSVSGSISFGTRTDVGDATAGESRYSGICDFDNDGKLDIVIANNYVNFFKNNTSGSNISFADRLVIPGALGASMVGLNDLDGDGKIDMVFANGGTGVITTKLITAYRNTSLVNAINFEPAIDYTTTDGVFTSSVALGDLDRDSLPDIAVSNYNGPTITLLKSRVYSPRISSFSPLSGCFGTTVTIKGKNFIGVTSVSFGGTPSASFNVNSDTTITAIVGPGSSGTILVQKPIGFTGTASITGFTYIPSLSTITSINPSTGGNGTIVTISGTNFTGATAVSFGGVPATSFSVISPTTISALVGTGNTGSVNVTVSGCITSFPGFIYGNGPGIASFTPLSGATGATVTITGTNFTGATAVSFGGIAASSFTVVNATTITAVIGIGASGSVSVTTPAGTATLAGFTYNVVTAVGGVNANNSPELTVNPNPGSGIVLVKHPNVVKNAQIRFIDLLGRIVLEVAAVRNTKQTAINVQGLVTGMYKITWSDGKKILVRSFMVK